MKKFWGSIRLGFVMISLLLSLVLIPAQHALAATCTSTGAGGNWSSSLTWSGCLGGVPGIGDDVVIAVTAPVTLDIAGAANSLTVRGALTFNNDLTVSGTTTPVLNLVNNIDLNGHTLTLNGNGSYSIRVTGAGARTINGTGGGTLELYTSSGTNTITVSPSNGGSLVIGTGATLDISAASNLATKFNPGASGLTTINGTLMISYGGQVTANSPYYGNSSHLVYKTGNLFNYVTGTEWPAGDTGASIPMNVQISAPDLQTSYVILPDNTHRSVRGDFTLDQNTTIRLSNVNCSAAAPDYCGLNVYGNWYNDGGSIAPSADTVAFVGSSQQTIDGSATTIFMNLIIDNSNGVLLAHDTQLSYNIDMRNGKLDLAGYSFTLGGWAVINHTGGAFNTGRMIVADQGSLCKIFEGPLSFNFTYPIGDDTDALNYTPVNMQLPFNVYVAYSVCIRVYNEPHPNIPANVISYLNRYWKITKSGSPSGPSASFSATFSYDATPGQDVVGDENVLYSARWENANGYWTDYTDRHVDVAAHTFSVAFVTMLAEADYTPVHSGPTAVTMGDLKADPMGRALRLGWTAYLETGMTGYNIYRSTSPDGVRTKINGALIPCQAPGGVGPMNYTWTDATAQAGVNYFYWIEQVDTQDQTTLLGPVSATGPYALFLPSINR